MSIKILKKNCHQVLGSQKSKLTPPELVFQTAGAINPPPTKIGLNKTPLSKVPLQTFHYI